MKILYIGPYRNELSIGQASRNIVSSLAKDNDLTIRHIYVQNNNDYRISNDLLVLEQKDIESYYDTIIQHSTPYLLATYNNLDIAKKNIAIPIINKTINKKQYQNALSKFDNILTDDRVIESILTKSYGIDNIKLFNYNITNNNLNKINLDIHNQNKKFYFIGSFYNNKKIIKLIISSFYLAFGGTSEVSLILFITDNSDSVKQELQKLINDLKKELNILTTNYNHKIIVKTLSDEESLSVHNSCDIYISLHDSGIESNIHRAIAEKYNNTIIDESNTNMIYDIDQGYGDTYSFGELTMTTNNASLSQSMISSIVNKTTKNNTTETIDKILCP
jgi:hypothetical protein